MCKGTGVLASSSFVITGLAPVIHVFASLCSIRHGCVDARNEPRHGASRYSVAVGEQRRIRP